MVTCIARVGNIGSGGDIDLYRGYKRMKHVIVQDGDKVVVEFKGESGGEPLEFSVEMKLR